MQRYKGIRLKFQLIKSVFCTQSVKGELSVSYSHALMYFIQICLLCELKTKQSNQFSYSNIHTMFIIIQIDSLPSRLAQTDLMFSSKTHLLLCQTNISFTSAHFAVFTMKFTHLFFVRCPTDNRSSTAYL